MSNYTRPEVNQSLNYEQASGLIANADVLLTEDIQQILAAVDYQHVKKTEAEKFYYTFKPADRNMIRKSGQQGKIGWYDPATGTTTTNPTDARAIAICQLYLGQKRKCAYTHVQADILDMQVEHFVPNGGDKPDNWLLVLSNVNMNRKQSSMADFIDRHRHVEDKEAFIAKEEKRKAKNEANRDRKEMILDMTEDELRAFTPGNAKEWEYVHRAVGMSSLQKFRLTTDGVQRSGGSQGNYKEVLNTIALEYLHGSKELARQIYDTCRAGADMYVNGKIQNDAYVNVLCDAIELSNHQYVKYNRKKFTKRLLTGKKALYKWPNVK